MHDHHGNVVRGQLIDERDELLLILADGVHDHALGAQFTQLGKGLRAQTRDCVGIHGPAFQVCLDQLGKRGVLADHGDFFLPNGLVVGEEVLHARLLGVDFSGISKRKVEPSPTVLSTRRLPSISSVIFRQIANPRPDPPYSRVVELSTCWKASK